ncbi:hypothetical protein [Xanthobacter sediminis]
MAEVEADNGHPLAAVILLLAVVALVVVGVVLIGPAALGLLGILGTFLMFVALLFITVS